MWLHLECERALEQEYGLTIPGGFADEEVVVVTEVVAVAVFMMVKVRFS